MVTFPHQTRTKNSFLPEKSSSKVLFPAEEDEVERLPPTEVTKYRSSLVERNMMKAPSRKDIVKNVTEEGVVTAFPRRRSSRLFNWDPKPIVGKKEQNTSKDKKKEEKD